MKVVEVCSYNIIILRVPIHNIKYSHISVNITFTIIVLHRKLKAENNMYEYTLVPLICRYTRYRRIAVIWPLSRNSVLKLLLYYIFFYAEVKDVFSNLNLIFY